MNILIIDNGTLHLAELERLLSGHVVKVVDFNTVELGEAEKRDLIVLSGAPKLSVIGNENAYKKEIEVIKNCSRPIVGICLGFELIAYAFGAGLERMETKEKGIVDIEILEPGNIFANILNFKVYEAHRWVVKELPECLIGLAKSKDGFEVIKHKGKKIYGLQFHPEMFVDKTCGDEIFGNLIRL